MDTVFLMEVVLIASAILDGRGPTVEKSITAHPVHAIMAVNAMQRTVGSLANALLDSREFTVKRQTSARRTHAKMEVHVWIYRVGDINATATRDIKATTAKILTSADIVPAITGGLVDQLKHRVGLLVNASFLITATTAMPLIHVIQVHVRMKASAPV